MFAPLRILILVLLLLPLSQHAQISGEDSIEELLDLQYHGHDFEVISKAEEVLNLAEHREDTLTVVKTYLIMAYSYHHLENEDKALQIYNRATSLLDHTQETFLTPQIYSLMGAYHIFRKNPNTPEGLKLYEKALQLAKEQDNEKQVIANSVNLAVVYAKDLKDGKTANSYLEAIDHLMKNGRSFPANILMNYNAVKGVYASDMDTNDEAINYLNLAIKNALKLNRRAAIVDFYGLKARIFEKMDAKDSVIAALKQHFSSYQMALNREKIRQSEIIYAKFEEKELKKDLKRINDLNQAYANNEKKSKIIIGFTIFTIGALLFLIWFQTKNSRTVKALNDTLKSRNNALIKANQKARELSQVKSNFINTISHELRTPLYAVTGITSILMDDQSCLKNNRENLESLKLSSDYLMQLINDVLQLSKIDNNKVEVQNVNFNLFELVKNLVQSLDPLRHQGSNAIHVALAQDLPETLYGDKVRLQQILFNLVGNALKFTQHGDVWIRATYKQNQNTEPVFLEMEVEDTGTGISKERIGDIFDEFSQIKTDNKNFQGTGLGLAIVKKLVNLLKGEITVESEEGRGSTFRIVIPFNKGNLMEDQQKIDINTRNIAARILVVDDNRINRKVTGTILKKENFICQECSNGSEAVEAVHNNTFDLVLMDLNMPVMDGFTASRKIREFNKIIPIIALTASSKDEIYKEIAQHGMQDIITKPYDKTVFFQTILKNLDINPVKDHSLIKLLGHDIKLPKDKSDKHDV